MSPRSKEECLSGRFLYGDDFTPDEIARWYNEEEYGYYNMATSYNTADYGYHTLNWRHAFRHIADLQFKHCIVLGCARGDDVLPIANQVKKFLALEPAERWWSENIGGTPAEYKKPTIQGRIEAEDNSFDLAVSLGVLHHIPNVSFVLSELTRLLSPGGYLIIREPIQTMGDWTLPRRGLTKNERGLPLGWLHSQLTALGLQVTQQSLCMFPATTRIAAVLNLQPYTSKLMVTIDAISSAAFTFNAARYNRRTFLQKLAPNSAFIIARKT